HNVVAELLVAVPRAAPGDEGGVFVRRREHAAGGEAYAESACMRAGGDVRHRHADAGAGPLDRGVGNALGVAVGEAVEGALVILGNAVQLVLRSEVALPV